VKPIHDPLVPSPDELDPAEVRQQLRANLSRSIDIWLRRTHAGGSPAARRPSDAANCTAEPSPAAA